MTVLRRLLVLIPRFIFTAYFAVSAFYCLLAFNPFTYGQVVRFQLVTGLTVFVQWHPWLYWIAALCAAGTLLPDMREAPRSMLAVGVLALLVAGGVALGVHPVLPTLGNNDTSLMWAHAFLAPVLLLGVVDMFGRRDRLTWPAADLGLPRDLFRSAIVATVLSAGAFGVLAWFRFPDVLAAASPVASVSGSLLVHALLFMGVFLLLLLAHGLSTMLPGSSLMEFVLSAGLFAAGVSVVFRDIIFSSMAQTGPLATWLSALFGAAFAVALAGAALRLGAQEETPNGGVKLLLAPFVGGRIRSFVGGAVWVVVLLVVGPALVVVFSAVDWNGLLQQLTAIATWAGLFAAVLLLPTSNSKREISPIRLFAYVSFAVLLLSVRVGARRLNPSAPASGQDAQVAAFLEHEPSFRLIESVLHAQRGATTSSGAIFPFLQKHTNLPHDVLIKPVDVTFVDGLTKSLGDKPNIFIFTIDSLRQDYLSPFNKSVTFTPAIGRFGAESDAFANAFSHYGATGLSEPSIWVGGMLPHKQYITPFAPMNALEKLVMAEGYTRRVSVDSILDELLTRDENFIPLDAHVAPRDYDFCATLQELQEAMTSRTATEKGRPTFVYTQPQNIHIARINREGPNVPAGATYTGFHAPYAHRVSLLDQCFGKFIDHLKETGEWDKSIVVLTADHGDALGEGGRWGHAYTIFPEILRIPLLMHVPPRWREGLAVDVERPVFSTDITPTLYALLGHPPTPPSDAFGVPLYGASLKELGKRPTGQVQDWFMTASSYGPVYGVLEASGQRLYIADAVNLTDHYYDLTKGLEGATVPLTSETRARNEQRLRNGIERLHEFYQVGRLP